MQETQVWSLGRDDLLEKEMATHSSTFAWKIPLMDKPGKLQSMGLQTVGHDWMTSLSLQGIFHAKMGLIKDRNGMDLTEAEDIKKRWQEYTEKLYKKDLHDPGNHDGVIIH